MKNIIKEVGSYNLNLIKTNKFKSLFFDVIFTQEIKKDNITINNLLIDTLLFNCNKYKTPKEMNIKKQDLYDAKVSGFSKRMGNLHVTTFSLAILDPKYTEEGMLLESLDFFKEILFNPFIKDKAFDLDTFNLIKNNTKVDILSTFENKSYYTISRLKENMYKTLPISYRMEGYVEDLDNITNKSLYKYYLDLFNNSCIDIYVVGDFNEKEVINYFKKNFKFNSDYVPIKLNIKNNISRENPIEIIEQSNYNQSNLAIGYDLNHLSYKEKNYAMVIYNIILGNSPESKLFQNIREKKSFAYSISSIYRMLDNTLIISAGISYKNYKDIINAIDIELEEMKKGNFSIESLENAKKLFITTLDEIDEYKGSIIDYFYSIKYFNRRRIKTEIKNIQNITKEDIIKVAKKINLDTIYLLKEDEDNYEKE